MGVIARSLLTGAGFLVAGAAFAFIGYHIGQALQGSPAAPLALAVGLMAIGGIWWRIRTQR